MLKKAKTTIEKLFNGPFPVHVKLIERCSQNFIVTFTLNNLLLLREVTAVQSNCNKKSERSEKNCVEMTPDKFISNVLITND